MSPYVAFADLVPTCTQVQVTLAVKTSQPLDVSSTLFLWFFTAVRVSYIGQAVPLPSVFSPLQIQSQLADCVSFQIQVEIGSKD